MESLPTPPNEDHIKPQGPKRQHSSSKTVKTVHRGSKRANTHVAHPLSPAQESHSHAIGDARHKRVWKACERCRMKKTKCDGEFPCKRCKDDGLVCTAGTRKKTEYKQLPRGKALPLSFFVLENTQFALIATVHKLYAMVRNQQPWDLGEPELNDRGQPVIHNIASKLGCIRPNSDMDLPVHSVFPEDEAGLAELARQLEEQQKDTDMMGGAATSNSINGSKHETDSSCNRTDRDSSSELDHSDIEQDYRKSVFGGNGGGGAAGEGITIYSAQAPSVPTPFGSWMNRPASMDYSSSQPFISSNESYLDMDMLNQGLLESSFGTIKPHVVSCPNPDIMIGMGDPMMYSGYDVETLQMGAV
ncbi:hypothetical protein B0T17DRAFT_588719 [Bombardia bombarda]|uniref:Zn(2)-C6 fungal-type domain-containing protein n=1 Tax=Bombardia bombarda TaxID=252184 RepID=A0AA39X7B3_9PEZI|nr:hypothetical protein B0T17DRAFT_588719 [Bombardia bombarda]